MTVLVPKEVALLRQLRDEEDVTLRAHAAAALGNSPVDSFVMVSVVPALRRACDDDDRPVREAAAEALAKIMEVWKEFSAVRREIMDSYHSSSGLYASQVTLLLETLADVEVTVRRAAAAALKRSHRRSLGSCTEQIIESLSDALRDADAMVRQQSADALFNIAWRLREEQDRLLKESRLWARKYEIVRSLETFHRAAIPGLTMASNDPHESVRASVVEALGAAPNPTPDRRELLAILTGLLRDKDTSVRFEAVEALSNVSSRCEGEEHAQIVEALTAALEDPSKDVRSSAAKVLADLERRRE